MCATRDHHGSTFLLFLSQSLFLSSCIFYFCLIPFLNSDSFSYSSFLLPFSLTPTFPIHLKEGIVQSCNTDGPWWGQKPLIGVSPPSIQKYFPLILMKSRSNGKAREPTPCLLSMVTAFLHLPQWFLACTLEICLLVFQLLQLPQSVIMESSYINIKLTSYIQGP